MIEEILYDDHEEYCYKNFIAGIDLIIYERDLFLDVFFDSGDSEGIWWINSDILSHTNKTEDEEIFINEIEDGESLRISGGDIYRLRSILESHGWPGIKISSEPDEF